MESEWTNSRRTFVKSILLTGIALQLPWIQSCSTKKRGIAIPDDIHPLSLKEYLNLYAVLDILFPQDGNGPSAIDVKADHYILWTLKDKNLEISSYNFLLDNLKKLNKEAIQLYKKNFHEMGLSEQEDFIATLSKKTWGENWLSRLLSLIFEALLLDPQYHVNPKNIGWEWLEHNPGYPRPKANQLYPTILNKKHEV